MDATVRVRTVAWFATAIVLSILATLVVMQNWRAEAAPGDTDSTFVPIANCRLFDFRPGADNVGPKNTPLGAGESNVYTQSVHGTNGACNIPLDAVGVALNVTIVSPTAQSNLRVFPADIATPDASNLNWLPDQSPTPNKVDVKLSPAGKVKLYNHAGTVNVLADAVGYYTNSSLQELANGLAAANTKIVALEMAQPFTESMEVLTNISLSNSSVNPTKVVSTTVDAPVDGRVSVHVSAYAADGDSDSDRVLCSITTGTSISTPRIIASPMPLGAFPVVAGVRTFDVAAGSSTEFKLLCYEINGDLELWERTMAAIFTPSP